MLNELQWNFDKVMSNRSTMRLNRRSNLAPQLPFTDLPGRKRHEWTQSAQKFKNKAWPLHWKIHQIRVSMERENSDPCCYEGLRIRCTRHKLLLLKVFIGVPATYFPELLNVAQCRAVCIRDTRWLMQGTEEIDGGISLLQLWIIVDRRSHMTKIQSLGFLLLIILWLFFWLFFWLYFWLLF